MSVWVVRTARLGLRTMTADDAPDLRRLNDDPEVFRFTGDGPLVDDEAARAIVHTRILPQWERYGVGRFAVHAHVDGAFLGWCGLRYDPPTDDYDLGYRFLRSAWGQGYATEAARGVLDWARTALPGARIVAIAHVDNVRSQRVLGKLGMVEVGRGLDDGLEVFRYAFPDR